MKKYLSIFVIIQILYSFENKLPVSYEELAFRYAPVHYQDTDNTNAKADYITKMDFDGNWKGTDNWDHLNSGNLSAHVYYSVVETNTHWYIIYAFYHPRDWSDAGEQVHENDLEGILEIVGKGRGEFGHLQAMITVAHTHFYSFAPEGGEVTAGRETIDGRISFQNHDGISRPKTCQEAKGHGVKAWPYVGNFTGRPSEDGIIYYPSKTTAERPSSGNDRHVKYKLVDVSSGMWFMQMFEAALSYEQSIAYAKWGTFKGDNSGGCGNVLKCPPDKANTPWGWDDENDGDNFKGELALDPAAVADYYFNGVRFDENYTRNHYLENLKRAGFKQSFLPRGWPSQLSLEDLYNKLQ